VPGNESRVVNLILSANGKVEHGEAVPVKILARSMAVRDEFGAMTLHAVASVPPSLAKPILYLHAGKPSGDTFGDVVCTAPFFGFCQRDGWMNTLEADPRGNADDSMSGQNSYAQQRTAVRFDFTLDTKLGHDLLLSAKEPVILRLKVAGATADMRATIDLNTADGHVGSGEATVAPTGPTEIQFLPMGDALRIKVGDVLMAHVDLAYPIQSTAQLTPPRLVPRGSTLTLPLVTDPNATQAPPPMGDAFITVRVNGDKDDFVNPGEARAFSLTVLNEGALEDVVTVAADPQGSVCTTDLRPGSQYRLPPGDSARLGVLVHAPAGAKEGAQCPIRVLATSRVDATVQGRADLLVTITSGTDMPNDALNYTANPDASNKLDHAKGHAKSPGLEAIGVFAVVAAFVAIARRRSKV
jgi:hypothetical protein